MGPLTWNSGTRQHKSILDVLVGIFFIGLTYLAFVLLCATTSQITIWGQIWLDTHSIHVYICSYHPKHKMLREKKTTFWAIVIRFHFSFDTNEMQQSHSMKRHWNTNFAPGWKQLPGLLNMAVLFGFVKPLNEFDMHCVVWLLLILVRFSLRHPTKLLCVWNSNTHFAPGWKQIY